MIAKAEHTATCSKRCSAREAVLLCRSSRETWRSVRFAALMPCEARKATTGKRGVRLHAERLCLQQKQQLSSEECVASCIKAWCLMLPCDCIWTSSKANVNTHTRAHTHTHTHMRTKEIAKNVQLLPIASTLLLKCHHLHRHFGRELKKRGGGGEKCTQTHTYAHKHARTLATNLCECCISKTTPLSIHCIRFLSQPLSGGLVQPGILEPCLPSRFQSRSAATKRTSSSKGAAEG